MVGYYPQLQDGELLYSATARLAAAIYPGRSIPYCAERLLGNPHSSFGLLLPNHVDKLLENIPAVTGLRREDALRGSIYFLQSLLLDKEEREKLSSSVFTCGSINTNGLRTFNARGAPTVLKYCVACAKRDAALKKPAIWRVVPNHPGSIACSEHGILLQISDAPASGNRLCDPAQWIKLDVPLPPVATAAELAIARDFDWIYAQHGKVTPGFQPIATKLREALQRRPGHSSLFGFLDSAKLLGAVQDNLSEPAWLTFAPLIGQLKQGRTLPMSIRTTLHVYSLFAYLADTSLRQVIVELATRPNASTPPNGGRLTLPDRILRHKQRIKDFLAANPACTRSQVFGALGHSLEVVQSEDKAWYERRMPKPRRHRTGRRVQEGCWAVRDAKLCALLSRYMAVAGVLPFRSFRDALLKFDQSRSLMRRERGRLPKFRALLESFITSRQAAA